ncbi:MAG: ferric-dicitrate binding protein FerR (iron transport regulator), partial [Bacteriovoracaceae bacterium]
FLRGEVLVNGKVSGIPRVLNEGDIIEARPLMKPKKTGSFVRITFKNGDKIGLSKAKMVIEKFNKSQSSFSLLKGKFFNYAKPGLERKITVKSRNVSLGVRGTKYMIDEQEDESYVCVCEGEVVATKGGRESSIKAGYDLHIKPGKPINQSVEASAAMITMISENFETLGEPVKKKD